MYFLTIKSKKWYIKVGGKKEVSHATNIQIPPQTHKTQLATIVAHLELCRRQYNYRRA
ncbi:hypothetical protein QUB28_27080 [Microcoleus sp. B4-C3]|uniref:hypothetical protein n=1 Tax=Microcoleus sp. B4-C2 TaxID=2818661 RepID=UPI002FD58E86